MKIKTALSKLALLGALSASLPLISTSANAQEVTLDATAAVVNTGIVLESELNEQTKSLLDNYKARGANVDELTARRQALQALITRSLILQLANNNGAEVTDMQLDTTLEQAALRNNTSVDKILASYGNISKEQAREKFKEDYLINEVRRSSVRAQVRISDTEINTLAKALKSRGSVEPMYHLGQIVIPLSSAPSEAEYQRVQAESRQALNAVRNGANIEEVAAKYAVNAQPADLGYLPETSVPLPFLPAILNAHPGSVVGPFRSSIGMHIIKVFDITQNAITPIKTYDAAHILVKTSIIFSDEAAIAKLQGIMSDVNSGKLSFAQAAKKYSEDPGSAINGGDLGYQALDAYDPGFAAGLEALKIGQYSKPVKSSYGWHVIYLKDVKVDKDSLDAYKEKANSIIFEREFTEAVASWERTLRESAYIHVIDPELTNAGVGIELDNEKNQKIMPTNDDQSSQAVSKNAKYIN